MTEQNPAKRLYVAETSLERKLKLYLKNNFNVLLCSKHGTGKTSMIKALWENEGVKYRFFSASTMDPWVDFIGVPKEKTDEANGKIYLDLIRPKEFAEDEVEAIFMDEYNRSHAKVRNAVMELIQFKSINGYKFKNLRVVWAAINPDDDKELEYDVERLDPAQKDRFHIYIELPYKPDKQYFIQKYGQVLAETACDWWNKITDKSVLNEVSPRRLDYALEVFLAKGDLEHVLPKKSNPEVLRKALATSSPLAELKKLIVNNDVEAIKVFIDDENNYDFCLPEIIKSIDLMKIVVPCMPPEKINSLIISEIKVQVWALKDYDKHPTIKVALAEIAEADQAKTLANQIRKRFAKGKIEDNSINFSKVNPNKAKSFVVYAGSNRYSNTVALKWAYDLATENNGLALGVSDRKKLLETLKDNMVEDLSSDEAIWSLSILNFVIKNTHEKQLDLWGFQVIGMINNAIENLMAIGKYDFIDFAVDYPDIVKYAQRKEGFYFENA